MFKVTCRSFASYCYDKISRQKQHKKKIIYLVQIYLVYNSLLWGTQATGT